MRWDRRVGFKGFGLPHRSSDLLKSGMYSSFLDFDVEHTSNNITVQQVIGNAFINLCIVSWHPSFTEHIIKSEENSVP